jgi:tRNA nucleotidyltransferase (CCA-adding enzyme)
MPAKTLKQLAIGGADVMAAAGGRRGGPWLADLLDRLLGDVALGELENDKDALLERVQALLPRYGAGTGGDA